jgi:hypothetical protein
VLTLRTSFRIFASSASTLTPYAVTFRYPGELPELSDENAKHAISLASSFWEVVLDKLPPQTLTEELGRKPTDAE